MDIGGVGVTVLLLKDLGKNDEAVFLTLSLEASRPHRQLIYVRSD